MKTIREGTVKPPFWVGKSVVCPRCNAKYELELGDDVKVQSYSGFGKNEIQVGYYTPCQEQYCGGTCKGELLLYRVPDDVMSWWVNGPLQSNRSMTDDESAVITEHGRFIGVNG